MEMQFDKIPVEYLQKLTDGLRTQEQTLEVRLPEGMPDIGRVLGSWGQVIVRGKEWNGDHMAVSCGVMVWTLYTPENEEGVRSVEAWIPFSVKWELPESLYDGKMLVSSLLKSVDARSISARKLMVRATLDVSGEAWVSDKAQVATPGQLPEDMEILTATYPMLLPKETGEKAFLLEEQLNAPGGAKPEKLLYYCLQPEVMEKKVMAGKLVFRGNASLHILYRGDDNRLYSCDYDLPFSQYVDLEGEYSQDASACVRLCVTSLDVLLDENGALQVKAGLLGQFLLYDREMVTVAEDAYSPCRSVVLQEETLYLPSVLDQIGQNVQAEQFVQADAQQVVDLAFYPVYGQPRPTDTGAEMPMHGHFQMLYYNPERELCCAQTPWEGSWIIAASQDSIVSPQKFFVGKPQAVPGPGTVKLRGEINAAVTVTSGQGIPTVSGLEAGEPEKQDANRPSLILCRKGNRRLWDVAKENSSTVETILSANHLDAEPEDSRVLLIPVK